MQCYLKWYIARLTKHLSEDEYAPCYNARDKELGEKPFQFLLRKTNSGTFQKPYTYNFTGFSLSEVLVAPEEDIGSSLDKASQSRRNPAPATVPPSNFTDTRFTSLKYELQFEEFGKLDDILSELQCHWVFDKTHRTWKVIGNGKQDLEFFFTTGVVRASVDLRVPIIESGVFKESLNGLSTAFRRYCETQTYEFKIRKGTVLACKVQKLIVDPTNGRIFVPMGTRRMPKSGKLSTMIQFINVEQEIHYCKLYYSEYFGKLPRKKQSDLRNSLKLLLRTLSTQTIELLDEKEFVQQNNFDGDVECSFAADDKLRRLLKMATVALPTADDTKEKETADLLKYFWKFPREKQPDLRILLKLPLRTLSAQTIKSLDEKEFVQGNNLDGVVECSFAADGKLRCLLKMATVALPTADDTKEKETADLLIELDEPRLLELPRENVAAFLYVIKAIPHLPTEVLPWLTDCAKYFGRLPRQNQADLRKSLKLLQTHSAQTIESVDKEEFVQWDNCAGDVECSFSAEDKLRRLLQMATVALPTFDDTKKEKEIANLLCELGVPQLLELPQENVAVYGIRYVIKALSYLPPEALPWLRTCTSKEQDAFQAVKQLEQVLHCVAEFEEYSIDEVAPNLQTFLSLALFGEDESFMYAWRAAYVSALFLWGSTESPASEQFSFYQKCSKETFDCVNKYSVF